MPIDCTFVVYVAMESNGHCEYQVSRESIMTAQNNGKCDDNMLAGECCKALYELIQQYVVARKKADGGAI